SGMLGMIVLFSIACTPPPPAVQTPALRTLAPEWNGDGRFNSHNYGHIHRNFQRSCWERHPKPPKYLIRDC
ncbi:MAG: hypothetical protein QF614_07380, partial [SAR324 cluster bacterium]|nr:hypothetical protein [SAR324 cluster bacterium]